MTFSTDQVQPFSADLLAKAQEIVKSYHIITQPDSSVGFIGHGAELPDCVDEGNTEEECISNVRKVMIGAIVSLLEQKLPIPLSSSGQDVIIILVEDAQQGVTEVQLVTQDQELAKKKYLELLQAHGLQVLNPDRDSDDDNIVLIGGNYYSPLSAQYAIRMMTHRIM